MEAIKGNRTINKLLVQKGEKEGSIRQIIALQEKRVLCSRNRQVKSRQNFYYSCSSRLLPMFPLRIMLRLMTY